MHFILSHLNKVFLVFVIGFFISIGSLWAQIERESKVSVEAGIQDINESIEQESDKKVIEANEAYARGDFVEARELFKEAIYLSNLQIEEARVIDERVLSYKDELSKQDKKFWIERFIGQGDRLRDLGFYDRAAEEYEKVFLIDANNGKASKRIDKLRNRFIKEKKEELQLEDELIQKEIDRRVDIYMARVEELIEQDKKETAERLLRRILVLSPKNRKAKKILAQLSKK